MEKGYFQLQVWGGKRWTRLRGYVVTYGEGTLCKNREDALTRIEKQKMMVEDRDDRRARYVEKKGSPP